MAYTSSQRRPRALVAPRVSALSFPSPSSPADTLSVDTSHARAPPPGPLLVPWFTGGARHGAREVGRGGRQTVAWARAAPGEGCATVCRPPRPTSRAPCLAPPVNHGTSRGPGGGARACEASTESVSAGSRGWAGSGGTPSAEIRPCAPRAPRLGGLGSRDAARGL